MISKSAQSKLDIFSVWSGPISLAIVAIGWLLVAGFFPIHRPSADAKAIAALFSAGHGRIQAGMVLVMLATVFQVFFSAVTAKQFARIEGGFGVLAVTVTIGGAVIIMTMYLPAIWWMAASYRVDRPDELIRLMNDQAWLSFVGGVLPTMCVNLAVVIAAFADDAEGPDRLFPRWFGYLTIFTTMMTLSDQILFFVHRGPFAWDGLFALWLPAFAALVQLVIMIGLIRRAVLRQSINY